MVFKPHLLEFITGDNAVTVLNEIEINKKAPYLLKWNVYNLLVISFEYNFQIK